MSHDTQPFTPLSITRRAANTVKTATSRPSLASGDLRVISGNLGNASPANVASSPGGGAAPRRSRVSSCPLGERTRTRLRSGPLRHAGKVTVRCKSSPRLSQPDCLRASPTASAATLHLGGVAPDSANATVTPTAGRGHATRSPAADPGGRYVLRGSPPLSAISRVMRCPKADA